MKYQLSDLLIICMSSKFLLQHLEKVHFLMSSQLNILGETSHSFAYDLLEKLFC